MQVDFYHLTAQPLARVLPMLAEKVVASGERLLVVAGDDAQRTTIDRLLWTYAADSFLPHGVAGSGDEDRQPVLIAGDVTPTNGARHVLIADGVWRDAALAFDRAFHLFDEDAIVTARSAWKALADRDGVTRRYWKQDDDGRWRQAA